MFTSVHPLYSSRFVFIIIPLVYTVPFFPLALLIQFFLIAVYDLCIMCLGICSPLFLVLGVVELLDLLFISYNVGIV